MLLDEFEPDRSLSGDDGIIVKGMHESEVLSLAAAHGFGISFVIVRAVQNNIGSITASRRNFDSGVVRGM